MASRLERSRGWIAKQALAAWVDHEEQRRSLTLEGLDDVDGGRNLEHAAIEAWAAGLDDGPREAAPR